MTIQPRINPIESLAVSMQSQPGVYAMLLGSGVSSGAGIMTGWQITLDLVSKLAASQNEDVGADPSAWYESQYEHPPNYSTLLESLANTPTERQNLLRPYFEPTESERADGVKMPTVAHRAIAELVKNGYVRVIITTNFDKLLEQALRDHGVEPTVLDSADNVQGALPLTHIKNCVIKLHGDYLDSEIRNTPKELACYPESYDRLLDRVFDEYDLVVCGWSTESDEALASAMLRATARRFTTFWSKKDDLNDRANAIVAQRQAVLIEIPGANEFFQELSEKVNLLQHYGWQSELSTASVVSTLKTVLPDPSQQIRHTDLVRDVTNKLKSGLSEIPIGPPDAPLPDSRNFNDRVMAYEELCSTLMAAAPVAGRWVSDTDAGTWIEALRQVATVDATTWNEFWINVRLYPVSLSVYAFCLGALVARNFRLVGSVLQSEVTGPTGDSHSIYQILGHIQPNHLHSFGSPVPLYGYETRRLPISDRLHDILRQGTEQLLVSSEDYSALFDEFEILLTIGYATRFREASFRGPVGRYVYRRVERESILAKMQTSIETEADVSPYVACEILGKTVDDCLTNISRFQEFADRARIG